VEKLASFAHLKAKMLSASGGFAPDQGLCTWIPLKTKHQTPITSLGSVLPMSPHFCQEAYAHGIWCSFGSYLISQLL